MKKLEAITLVRDCTDRSGGAVLARALVPKAKAWEREGLIELHVMNAGGVIARITDKGRKFTQ